MAVFGSRQRAGFPAGVSFFAGLGLGAIGAMLFDPRRGAARRAYVRDRSLATLRRAAHQAQRRGYDLAQRTKGLLYEAKGRWTEGEVSDEVLAERVRSQIGRPVSHPRALEVTVQNGSVTLAGPILAHEVDDLIERVSRVRGVRSIHSDLELHEDSAHVPALQGDGSRQAR